MKKIIMYLLMLVFMTSKVTAQEEEDCREVSVSFLNNDSCFSAASEGDSVTLSIDHLPCFFYYKIVYQDSNYVTGRWDSIPANRPWEPNPDYNVLELKVRPKPGFKFGAYRVVAQDLWGDDHEKEYYSRTLYVSECIPITIEEMNIDSLPFIKHLTKEDLKPAQMNHVSPFQQRTSSSNGSKSTSKKLNAVEKKISIFPNPTSGSFKIELNGNIKDGKEIIIRVFDAAGHQVITRNFDDGIVNIQSLSPGMYFVYILKDKQRVGNPIKIVKK